MNFGCEAHHRLCKGQAAPDHALRRRRRDLDANPARIRLGPLGGTLALCLVLLVVEAPLEHVAGEDGRLGVVEHGHHATNRQREELVGRWSAAVVDPAHALRSADAGKIKVLGVVLREACAAADDGGGGLGGDVVAEGRVPRLAAEADHAGQHGGPLVEVWLELDLRAHRCAILLVQ